MEWGKLAVLVSISKKKGRVVWKGGLPCGRLGITEFNFTVMLVNSQWFATGQLQFSLVKLFQHSFCSHYYNSYKQNLRSNNKPTLALTVQQNPHTAWSGVLRSRALLTWKEKVTASPSTFTASLGQPSRTTPLPPTPNELPPYSATLRPVVVLPA